jgi:hypothetical protein
LAAQRAAIEIVSTAIGAAVAWEAAVSAVAAAVVAGEAAEAEAAAEEEAADVEDKRAIYGERTNENKANHHDLVETTSNRCRDHYLQLSGFCVAGGVRAQTRCRGSVAV